MSSYAKPEDLDTYGIAAVSGFGSVDRQAALDAASTLADSYLANRVTTPIATPSADLVQAVCAIASWRLLCRRGFNPEDPGGAAVRLQYEDAIHWLERVSKGSATPACVRAQAGSSGLGGPVVVQPSVSGTDSSGAPVVITGAPSARGW